MRDEFAVAKRRHLPRPILIGALFSLFFIVLTTGYFWHRYSRPKLIIPTTNASNESLLRDSLSSASLPYELPFLIEGKTIVASVSGVTVYFSSAKNLAQQVRSLQLLLPEVTMSKEKISVIDLRFNKAVLR